MPRHYGHVRGAQNLETICREAGNMGIRYLTVYLFSTENWKRSREEIDGLMRLFLVPRTAARRPEQGDDLNQIVKIVGFFLLVIYHNGISATASDLRSQYSILPNQVQFCKCFCDFFPFW